MSQTHPSSRRLVLAAIALIAVLAALAAIWNIRETRRTGPPGPTTAATQQETVPSLSTLREVITDGGSPLTREAAIAWLDRNARERSVLSAEAVTTLLDLLREGHGHSAWSSGYRQHLFNSACNALRANPSGDSTESLARILHDHTTRHPDRILRLYALQHIDSLRKSGHLTDPLATEIHTTIQSIAASPENDVAGTAILLLAEWDGPATDAPPAVLELAAHTAADRSRPVDIRVSAIHTAGSAALETARAIAGDISEPILLRKAAIARIGRHGSAEDLDSLEALRTESARLAQAAGPAIGKLQSRLRNPATPAPIPYH